MDHGSTSAHKILEVLYYYLYCTFHSAIVTCPYFTSVNNYTCPGSTITYTCTISSSAYSITTVWSGSAFQCPATVSQPANQTTLLQKSGEVVVPTAGGSCGSLSAVTTDVTSSCYTSVLTIPAVQALNGTTVMCADGATETVVGSDTVKITGGLRSAMHPPSSSSLHLAPSSSPHPSSTPPLLLPPFTHPSYLCLTTCLP